MLLLGLVAGLTPAVAAGNLITTHAGAGSAAGDGGPAVAALLEYPGDVIVAPSGDVLIADSFNNKIRRIDGTGTITTVAGTGERSSTGDGGPATAAQLDFPSGLAADAAGNVFISERGGDRIRMIDPSGTITTVAGTGTAGFSGDGGAATSAQLSSPSGLALGGSGVLYVADSGNHRVRKIDPSGIITTVAGTGIAGSSGDGGAATSAKLNDPEDVAVDEAGVLSIADSNNHRIRRVSVAGIITTVAGTGIEGFSGDGGAATSARLDNPSGVAVDPSGRLLISDDGNARVRRVSLADVITTVAGNGSWGYAGDGGPATAAGMAPSQVEVDGDGDIYVADMWNHRIRKVDTGGIVTTIAGTEPFAGDGGPAVDALLHYPVGVTADGAGNVFLTDYGNHRVRKVDSSGVITTVAGNGVAAYAGDGGAATDASLSSPADVAVDASGNLFIADTGNDVVRKVSPAGTITTVAGTGIAGYSGDGGAATGAKLNSPAGLDVDGAGNLYVADSDNHRVRRVSPAGIITTVAGTGVAGYSGDGGAATSANLYDPVDAAVGPDGSLFIADYRNNRVRSVTSGVITTVAGNGVEGFAGDGGAATSASLDHPAGLDVDPVGNLFIADAGNHRIRQVATSGTISTVAGTGVFGYSGDGGPAVDANLAFPTRVALDGAGNFYLADTFNDRVRKVEALGSLPAPEMIATDPASPANDNAPFVMGTADAGTTVKIYTDEDCTAPEVASGTAEEFATPGIAATVADDTTTSFYATATDATGNVSACSLAPVVYAEDSTPPGPPTITDPPPTPGSDPAPAWSFSTDAGATTECELTRGATVVSATAPCVSPVSFDLSGEPDGDYTFAVRATDAAGNTGPATTDAYTLDRVGPAAPTITDAPSSPGNGSVPAWTFTAEPGATTECELTRGATVVSAYGPCASPASFDLSAEPDGDYTFKVRATDAAGNTGGEATAGYTYDTAGPTATIEAAPPSPGNDTAPAWGFSSEPGATTECELMRGATVISPFGPCTSPASYDLSGEPDGDYTFRVRATDVAGNTGAAASDLYTLDTSAPVATVTASPSSPDADPSPAWSFSAEPGATIECELTRGGTVISAFGPCTSPASYDLSAEPDGDYTFRVRATDLAGNTGSADTGTYAFDTSPPAPPTITDAPVSPGNDPSPAWTFTAEPGATTECELTRGGTVVSAYGPCASPASFDLSAEPDGDYTFKVRAIDAAGNTGTEAQGAYAFDTTGPAGPVITDAPSSPGNDTSPAWSFTAEPGVTIECELSRGGTVVSAQGPCVSPVSYDLSAEPDDAYTLLVTATDVAGNPGGKVTDTYVLDTTAPADPAISSAPVSPGNATGVSWSFTTEPGATTECELTREGTVLSAWSSCSSPASYDLGGQPDGDYTFRVRATDVAGNTGPGSSNTYTLDTTGPATMIDASPSSPGIDPFPEWTFSSEPGAASECELSRGAIVVRAFAPCGSPVAYDLSGEPDGDYTFRVRSTDTVGNVGPVASSGYTFDTTGPVTSIDSSPVSPGSDPVPAWAFSSEAGATTRCELSRGATVVSAYGPCASPTSYDLSGEPDGAYTLRVYSSDQLGNPGPEESATYTLDRTGPAPPSITGSPASPDTGRNPAWSFTAESGAITECELSRGSTVVSAWATCSGPTSFDLTGQPDGDFTFRVRATDEAGNTGGEASDTYTLDTTGPSVIFTAPPTSPGSSRAPTWSFTTEAGATSECELSSGGSVVEAAAACSSPAAFDLTGQPDGDYTLTVVATDGLGNLGASVDSTYTLDTVGPDTIITGGPVAMTSDRSPEWSFTTETGAATECQLSRGGTVLQPFAACATPDGYDLTAEPDGAYTFSVRASDVAGNVGPSGSRSFTLDTSVPLVSITSAPAAAADDRSPSWEFVAEAGAGTDCRLARGSTVVSPYAACTSPMTFDLSSRPDGEYTFHVRATDAAGNSASAYSVYTLDTTGPVTTISATPGPSGSGTSIEWRFTAEAGATTLCRLSRGATVISGYASCTSPAGYSLAGEPDGTYTFSVRASDHLGNPGPSTSSTYTLDRSGPGSEEDSDGLGGEGEGPIDDEGGGMGAFPPPPGEGEVEPELPRHPGADADATSPTSASDPKQARGAATADAAPTSGGGRGEREGGVLEAIGEVAAVVLQTSAFPLTLMGVALGFLVVQNRIDRRDPKLALAPVHPDPHLDFEPV